MDKTVASSSKVVFPPLRQKWIFLSCSEFKKFHLEFKSNLSPIQSRTFKPTLLRMRPIYLTVAIISPRTQQQRNSKWNQFSCHGLRIKKFQLELLFSKSIFYKSRTCIYMGSNSGMKKLGSTAFFQKQIAILQHFHKPSPETKFFVTFCNLR